jgi:ABC-2 type transport system permease protein
MSAVGAGVLGPLVAARRAGGRARLFIEEARKLPAFLRRDFLVAWSYRASFASDWINLTGQLLLFAFIGRLIDPGSLPRYGGTEVTYLEFAAIGIAVSVFVQFGLTRVGAAIRGEQLMGTLESLLMTPTAPTTIQLGSVVFDLVYLPLRTAAFLLATAMIFGLHFSVGGVLPALLVLVAFIPFVWGLGVLSAAILLVMRRGAGVVGVAAMLLAFTSGAYFPLDLLPGWIVGAAELNPIALAVDGMRDALLGDASTGETFSVVATLAPLSVLALLLGIGAFRLSLRRERRLGTVGLY